MLSSVFMFFLLSFESFLDVVPVIGILFSTFYDWYVNIKPCITNVSYKFDPGYGSPTLNFVISGEKTYGSSNSIGYDIISYKLYDGERYLVNSGQVYLGTSLNKDDKFKDDSLIIYDITPGEFYTLQLMNYEY